MSANGWLYRAFLKEPLPQETKMPGVVFEESSTIPDEKIFAAMQLIKDRRNKLKGENNADT